MRIFSLRIIIPILALVALSSYPILFLIRGYSFSLMTRYALLEYTLIVFLINLLLLYIHLVKSKYLAKKYPWIEKVRSRFIWELVLTTTFTPIIVTAGMYTLYVIIWESELWIPGAIEYNLFALTFSLFLGFMVNARDIITKWKASILEKETLEKEAIKANLKVIQANISPHFLFNNFNVLHALIEEDTEQAQQYLGKLSEVYRFILKRRNEEVVSLEEEVDFIKDYLFLLTIRFGDQVKYSIKIPDYNGLMIPPATLQILVENAIKHNEVSIEKPLQITIKKEDSYLSVSNNIQIKKGVTDSVGFGLENIKERFLYLSEKPMVIEKRDSNFAVKIPLLEK